MLTTKRAGTAVLRPSHTALAVKGTATWSMLMIYLEKEEVSCLQAPDSLSHQMRELKKLF